MDAYTKGPFFEAEEAIKAADNVERLLRELWDLYESGDHEFRPQIASYNILLKMLSKMPTREGAEKTEHLLNEIWSYYDPADSESVKPNRISYRAVLEGWAVVGDPERVERVLQDMWDRSEAGDKDLTPNRIFYNGLIRAWGRSAHPNLAEKAEGVLRQMWDLHNANADNHEENAEIDTNSSTLSIKPTRATYHFVMMAWAEHINAKGLANLERLLREMWELYKQTGDTRMAPNTAVYNTIVNAWYRSAHPKAALHVERLVIEMSNLAKQNEKLRCTPDKRTYKTTIKTWDESNEPNKDTHTQMWHQQMVHQAKEKEANALLINPTRPQYAKD